MDVAAALAETAGPGDHKAVDLLREAAAEIAAGAPSEAVALSRKALELSGPAGPHTAEIDGETVELLGRDGRYAEAESLAATALEGFLAPEAEARLRLRVARLVGPSSACEAVRHCRIGLSLPGLPEELRDRLSAVEGLYLAQMDDPVQAGPSGLTAAEAKVARLVAQEATNRQVAEQLSLSCHTVNSHLRHVFTKWDINSRVDLARLMLAREAGTRRAPGGHDRRPRR